MSVAARLVATQLRALWLSPRVAAALDADHHAQRMPLFADPHPLPGAPS